MSPAEHKQLQLKGRTAAAGYLDVLSQQGLSPEGIESVAAGMVMAIRDHLIAFLSEQHAFAVLDGGAQSIGEQLIRRSEAR